MYVKEKGNYKTGRVFLDLFPFKFVIVLSTFRIIIRKNSKLKLQCANAGQNDESKLKTVLEARGIQF